MSIIMKELENEIIVMLHALRVNFKVVRLIKSISVQFVIDQFGTIVCGINRADYKIVDDQIKQSYLGFRVLYITTFDNMLEKKDEVIFALMRGGYIKYIRLKYPRAFNELIAMQNFGVKIINQRLKIWNNLPKYKFMIEDNEDAKRNLATYVLALDQAFYDTMPGVQ